MTNNASRTLVCPVCGGTRFVTTRPLVLDTMADGRIVRRWGAQLEDSTVVLCAKRACATELRWDAKSFSYVVVQG